MWPKARAHETSPSGDALYELTHAVDSKWMVAAHPVCAALDQESFRAAVSKDGADCRPRYRERTSSHMPIARDQALLYMWL